MATTVFLAVWVPLACTAMKTNNQIGIHNGRLAPCPSTPNCVSSDAEDESHLIEPFHIASDVRLFWETLKQTITDRPRTRIVTVTEDYLHAEEKSRIFGFVDDIEFHLRPSEGVAAVRSASRTGRSDLGVNRKRVEAIRSELKRRGVVR
jgi:uncharacterized protein (DUF1499 family)